MSFNKFLNLELNIKKQNLKNICKIGVILINFQLDWIFYLQMKLILKAI
jgi:hypothetical protein